MSKVDKTAFTSTEMELKVPTCIPLLTIHFFIVPSNLLIKSHTHTTVHLAQACLQQQRSAVSCYIFRATFHNWSVFTTP